MKSFFEDGVYEELRLRLDNLKPESKRHWGKMSVAQMLHHCQMPLNIILQNEDYGLKPNWLISLLFKKSLYSDKAWKKNTPTAKAFIIKDDKNFNSEKEKITTLLNALYTKRNLENWPKHPTFGAFTKTQWGKMQYKHLDHHFRQFGV